MTCSRDVLVNMDANDSPPLKIQKLCEEHENVSQNQDRLSILPDDILLDILSFLTTTEIIRTSVLSKRWQHLWISIPNLNFDFGCNTNSTLSASFINLVHKALLLRNDLCIQEFHLRYDHMPVCTSDVFVWISAAVGHKVQKLELSLSEKGDFLLPADLFTSQSMRKFKLELFYGRLIVPSSVHLCSLKTLYLFGVQFHEDKFTEQLFGGCPVLEELVLENCWWINVKNVTLCIPSLKRFTINYDCLSRDELLDCKIKICAENLISFCWSGYMIVELLLNNLSSLVYAYVDVIIHDSPEEEKSQRAVKLLSVFQNVKSLSLSYDTLKVC